MGLVGGQRGVQARPRALVQEDAGTTARAGRAAHSLTMLPLGAQATPDHWQGWEVSLRLIQPSQAAASPASCSASRRRRKTAAAQGRQLGLIDYEPHACSCGGFRGTAENRHQPITANHQEPNLTFVHSPSCRWSGRRQQGCAQRQPQQGQQCSENADHGPHARLRSSAAQA